MKKTDKEFKKLVRLIENTHPFYVETIAERVYKKYQPKIDKDSVVLSREEYERLKRVEAEKDRLYEIKLDLENQLIEKGWTDYEGADEIEKRVSKETATEIIDYVYRVTANIVLRDKLAKQFEVEVK